MSSRRYGRNAYQGRKRKTDANQDEIITALELAGASVVAIGKPLDLLVGFNGVDFLLEVKNPDGKNRIEPDQEKFINEWRGRPPVIVRSVDDALDAIGARVSSLSGARLAR